jgi:hypothetical protein
MTGSSKTALGGSGHSSRPDQAKQYSEEAVIPQDSRPDQAKQYSEKAVIPHDRIKQNSTRRKWSSLKTGSSKPQHSEGAVIPPDRIKQTSTRTKRSFLKTQDRIKQKHMEEVTPSLHHSITASSFVYDCTAHYNL